eukprot:GILK01000516.1.p1 GENE.GILK01000516.1~~GILK01000516.1.p1  ORF type:complete len:211 (+),score=34.15 GILK01000516.1:86-718(+)
MAEPSQEGAPAGHRKSVSITEIASPDELPENTPGYVPPRKASLREVLSKDADDESLNKYKQSLLGGAAASGGPLEVKINKLTIIVPDRPQGNIVLDLSGENKNFKRTPYILREGSTYHLEFEFTVSNEVVMGLRWMNFVYKHGFRVEKDDQMLGSFAPKPESQTIRLHEETTPAGMIARGNYTAKSRFVDDDGVVHCEYEYAFSIKKDWE